jgi:hypothetical protein
MIQKAAGGDSHRPTIHWSFCQSPVASMVPGFVLIPLVTLPPPKAEAIPFRRLPILHDLGRRPRRLQVEVIFGMSRKRKTKRSGQTDRPQGIPILNPNAAGLDIGANEIYAAVLWHVYGGVERTLRVATAMRH